MENFIFLCNCCKANQLTGFYKYNIGLNLVTEKFTFTRLLRNIKLEIISPTKCDLLITCEKDAS